MTVLLIVLKLTCLTQWTPVVFAFSVLGEEASVVLIYCRSFYSPIVRKAVNLHSGWVRQLYFRAFNIRPDCGQSQLLWKQQRRSSLVLVTRLNVITRSTYVGKKINTENEMFYHLMESWFYVYVYRLSMAISHSAHLYRAFNTTNCLRNVIEATTRHKAHRAYVAYMCMLSCRMQTLPVILNIIHSTSQSPNINITKD